MRGGGFLSNLPPVVKWLLITNVSIFLFDYLILQLVLGNWFDPNSGLPRIAFFSAFKISSAIEGLQLWQFISFQFMHGGLMHVAFNSVGLFIFGPWMERWWGPKKFLLFYLISGAGGAAFYSLLFYSGILDGSPHAPLVGASAGIYGILIGVAMIAPNMRVQLIFPPIELTMRQLAILILAIATGTIFFNLRNAGGEAGHIGGAILGYILMKFPQLLGNGPRVSIHPPRAFQSKMQPRTEINLSDNSEVDAILDKISNDGFQSLTDEEKEILKKAANKD